VAAAGSKGARAPHRGGAAAGPVPTIGSPRYDDQGATGGQDVRFHDAGMSALVVGRTVFIWGAEIVQSSESFELVEGERVAFDGAVVREHQVRNPNPPTLSSVDQLYAPLKLAFDQGTTTTLTLFSSSTNPDLPDREMRTWTFRVR
jgi:hypothetical protein